MDQEAMTIISVLLAILSYAVTFMFGYGMRSYIYSRQRRYPQPTYE